MRPFIAVAVLSLAPLALAGLVLVACTKQARYQPPGTYADPAAYCLVAVTIDKPDARYVGPAVPDWVALALRKVTGAAHDAPIEPFRNAVWRCADGAVLACTVGANIPCDSKGDTSRVPTQAAIAYCLANPNGETVPASVTGHATVYDWSCKSGKAVAGDQVLPLDSQGYPSVFWYRVTPQDGTQG